ncbi:MAG: hypothetical protein OQK73_09100 [Gammaproteobacteria bacterium]|nr:hypothetical protein [Gammaproteobacteria bacterium]
MRAALMIFLGLWSGLIWAEVLDDPTRPPGFAKVVKGKAVAKNQWWLNAIRIDAQSRIAIINGRTVEEGGWVNNAYVVKILPDKVKLKGNAGEFFVRLVNQQVKVSSGKQNGK